MVYSVQHDNYMAYVIEIVDLVETVQIATLNSNFDDYTKNNVAVTGIVYEADKNGLFIMDNSGNSLYVLVGYSDVFLGQTVTFTGVTYQYYSLPEFKCVTYTRGEIVEYNLTLYSGTISRFIEVNTPQSEKVLTHNVYRLTGVLTNDGNDYYLTYDQDRIQIKSSTFDDDYANLSNYIDQNISINVVLVDYHSTLEVFRVIPLVGDEANIEIAINKLAAPVLTINESGLVSWQAIENAIMYEYIINEGITYVTDDLSVQISQGDTIYVRALGDGDNYTSSDYSSISYLAQSLTIGQINENFDAYTETQVQVSGTVFARDLYGFFIIDENQDTLYIRYNYAIDDIQISQAVTVVGNTYKYYSLPQFVATQVICGDIVTFDMNLYTGTIEEIIAAVSDSSSMVYDHYVFRVTGDLVREGDDYFLVDGDYRLQIKSSMWDVEYNILTPFVDKNISVNVVLYDYFSTTSIFRVIPLPGSDMNVEMHVATQGKCDTPVLSISETGLVTWEAVPHAVQYMYKINSGANQSTQNLSIQLSLGDTIVIKAMGDGTYTSSDWSEPITYVNLNAEPEHIETTVANLVNNKPTEEKTVIYEVTAYWTLKDGGSTYGNGWLHDGQGNQITVYGLCASDSVLTWSNGAYTYQNNQSYSSTGINDGDMITVGMVYSVQYDNFMCYLIEIVEEAGSQTYIDINFIMINDTHGAFTDSSEGNSIGRIDTLVESLEAANGDYIFIHNGDAFQGSYVCGETYGLAMIEALNASGVDCFVIGNHEFDWGIDKIAAYRDGDLTNGEANFPFLGANIYYKGTTTRPEWLDAYTIIEQDGVKVGIIGIMGPDQETSILTRYVKDYDFVEPLEIVQTTSAYLRDTLGCDVVVVATHDYDYSTNYQYARLSGSSRIDAIFCAHTHENIYETMTRSDSKVIPVVQCNHKNVNAAEVILKVNEEFEYTSHSATKHQIANMNTNPTTYYYEISDDVLIVIDSYQDLIDESNEVIGSVAGGLTKSTLGAYAVDAMLNYNYSSYEFEGIDMAIMNTGGVRASIDSGDISRAEVFEVFPFNNSVVLVNMSGALIKEFYGNNSGYMYMDIDTQSIVIQI